MKEVEVSLKVLNNFCNLAKVARELHEEATPLWSLKNPKHYEVEAGLIKELGDALQELGEEIFLDGIE